VYFHLSKLSKNIFFPLLFINLQALGNIFGHTGTGTWPGSKREIT